MDIVHDSCSHRNDNRSRLTCIPLVRAFARRVRHRIWACRLRGVISVPDMILNEIETLNSKIVTADFYLQSGSDSIKLYYYAYVESIASSRSPMQEQSAATVANADAAFQEVGARRFLRRSLICWSCFLNVCATGAKKRFGANRQSYNRVRLPNVFIV